MSDGEWDASGLYPRRTPSRKNREELIADNKRYKAQTRRLKERLRAQKTEKGQSSSPTVHCDRWAEPTSPPNPKHTSSRDLETAADKVIAIFAR